MSNQEPDHREKPAPDLRAAWQRIITNHQLDVPQLLWAHNEIERLRAEVAALRAPRRGSDCYECDQGVNCLAHGGRS